jgi:hypothetical protein
MQDFRFSERSFWDRAPSSPLKANRRSRAAHRLHLQSRRIRQSRCHRESRLQADLVSCSAYSSTLNIEVICSSETSVYIQRTIRSYITDDVKLSNNQLMLCCFRFVNPLSSPFGATDSLKRWQKSLGRQTKQQYTKIFHLKVTSFILCTELLYNRP